MVSGFHRWVDDFLCFLSHEDLLAQLMNESMFAWAPSFLMVSARIEADIDPDSGHSFSGPLFGQKSIFPSRNPPFYDLFL